MKDISKRHTTTPSLGLKHFLLVLLCFLSSRSVAQVPDGFYVISRSGGVTVYKKIYQGGYPDYVTVAKLNSGAVIKSLDEPSTGSPTYLLNKHTISDWVAKGIRLTPSLYQPKTIFNGTFFEYTDWGSGTTPITYGLRSSGILESFGVSSKINANKDVVRLLSFNAIRADVLPYERQTFSNWFDVIGAYSKDANPEAPLDRKPRNFFGCRDGDGDGIRDTIVFYATYGATKEEALNVLRGFKCDESTLGFLDSGLSSSLWIEGSFIYRPFPEVAREIAHAVAVYGTSANDGSKYVSDITIPDGTLIAANSRFDKIWQIRNSGNTVWGEGYKFVYNGGYQGGAPEYINVPPVNPRATVNLSVPMIAPANPGTYKGYWRLQGPNGLFGSRVYVEFIVPSAREVLIDNSNTASNIDGIGFFKWGTASYWHEAAGYGINNSMLWTRNGHSPDHPLDNVGQWRPSLSAAGTYQISAFIPRNYGTTKDANYEIWVNGSYLTTVHINQLNISDQWVSLGSYNLPAGTSSFVRILDTTSETYNTVYIGVDAVKFTPK